LDSEHEFPQKGRHNKHKELFMQVRILKMDPPKGETPQTEQTLQTNQDPEHGFPQRETPRQKELFNKVRIQKNGFHQREDPTDRKSLDVYECVYIHIILYPHIYIHRFRQ